MKRYFFLYFYIALSAFVKAQQLSVQDEQFVYSVMNANYKADEPGAVLLTAKKNNRF